ncbi:MAG: YncE family protein, partial [Candidatus Eisenbacteria bacterium]
MRSPMTARAGLLLSATLLIAMTTGALATEPAARARRPRATNTPGPSFGGRVLLPNGWKLSPPGRQVAVGDFPLGIAVSPDGRFAAVTHSGSHGKGIDVVDLVSGQLVQSVAVQDPWLGIGFAAGGRRLVVSAGLSNRILLFAFDPERGAVLGADTVALGPAWSGGGLYPQGQPVAPRPDAIWPTGLSVDDASQRLFVVSRLDSAVTSIDLRTRRVQLRRALAGVPYRCLVSRDGQRVYVSLWSRAQLAVLDAATLAVLDTIAVGEHPCDLEESPDGRFVFVANANENTVSVVDRVQRITVERLRTSRSPGEPDGDTPNSLALSDDGARLYVANAGANHVAVFDVAKPGQSEAEGFIPVGWYPTAVAMRPGAQALVVANGKGAGSQPSSSAAGDTSSWCRYVTY